MYHRNLHLKKVQKIYLCELSVLHFSCVNFITEIVFLMISLRCNIGQLSSRDYYGQAFDLFAFL